MHLLIRVYPRPSAANDSSFPALHQQRRNLLRIVRNNDRRVRKRPFDRPRMRRELPRVIAVDVVRVLQHIAREDRHYIRIRRNRPPRSLAG